MLTLLLGAIFMGVPVNGVAALAPGGTFVDDDGNAHEGAIEAIFAEGLTNGCSQDGQRFCPGEPVSRAAMAAFLVRAIGLEPTADHQFLFGDVPPSAWYAPYVERLASAGVVIGYPDGLYRPDRDITRGEMAALLIRAFDHLEPQPGTAFSDIPDGAWYAPAVGGLLAAGVTSGCAIDPLRFCPSDPVRRDQMATFMMRAKGLVPIVPPPRYDGPALTVIHVDQRYPGASDSNPGTIDRPMVSIQAAVDRSNRARREGRGIRIVVHPGVYRESIEVGYAGSNPPPLHLESAKPGEAIVSGADLFRSWSFDPITGAHVHAWQHDWGGASGVPPIAGRREMIFVDGERLVQVLDKSQLGPGKFIVDEPGNRIYARSSTGSSISAAEVAVRARTLTLEGATNTTVRGFVFRHAASPFDDSSVGVFNGVDNTLEANTITQNGWTGIGVATTQSVTFSRNLITRNGGGGMSIYKSPSLRLISNTTSHNNWRGAAGGYTGWSIAAVKMVGVHDAEVDQHTSMGNATRGFWVDYDIRRVSIRDSVFSNNLTDGLFVEAAPGPVTITGTTLSGNGRYGLLLSNVQATSVVTSTMCSNGKSAIRVDTDPGGRSVDSALGSVWLPAARDLVLQGSTLGASERLMDSNVPSSHWQEFVQTLRSNNNTWIPSNANTAFVFLGQQHDISGWRNATGQDTASSIAISGCG